MIKLQIEENKWVDFGDIEKKIKTPYWFKKTNGNIVLSAYITTDYSSGWANCYINDEGTIMIDHNCYHILRDAKVQIAEI